MSDFKTLHQIEINDLKLKLRDLQSEYDNYVKHMTADINQANAEIDDVNSGLLALIKRTEPKLNKNVIAVFDELEDII